ncbi:MAG: glycosyltransferase family 9 protein [candidate division FCPU426 bacterium]
MLDPKNILLIRMRAFGDTLLTTPTLRGLKAAYPKAKLSVLVEPAVAKILEGLPYIDEIVTFDRLASKGKGAWHELKSNLKFWRQLRRQHYDLVLDVLGTPRTAWLSRITGAPTRVGFDFRVRRYAYTHVCVPSKERRYIADYTADLLRVLGHEPDSLDLDFVIPSASKARAGVFFSEQGWQDKSPLAVQNAGGWEIKRYPAAQMAKAVRQIVLTSPRPVLYLWGPGEAQAAAELMSLAGVPGALAPLTDFADMAALLQKCSFLLTNDTATKHLAVAVDCPSLTVFGPTSDVAWHPGSSDLHRSVRMDLECMPCEALSCRLGTHACMVDLSSEAVATAALGIFEEMRG